MWCSVFRDFPQPFSWYEPLPLSGFVNALVSFAVQFVFPWELATFGSAGTFFLYGFVGLMFTSHWKNCLKQKGLPEEIERMLTKNP